ncbi:MAG: hypothetical protein N2381_11355, partial [Armatimonadetes bacterium]|nr:hypothetical protein [Armatimonadota bacterium]
PYRHSTLSLTILTTRHPHPPKPMMSARRISQFTSLFSVLFVEFFRLGSSLAFKVVKVIIGLPKFVRTEKFSPNKFGAYKFAINHWLKPVAWI